jgi:hypothetical protein
MEETRFFGRMSVYALAVGAVYWVVSYEPAGTAMLVGFGLASGGAFLWLWLSARGMSPANARDAPAAAASTAPDGPFGDESGPVPMASAAPLAIGLGVAGIALAGAFGPWFAAAGAVPLLMGATAWLGAANRELALRTRLDKPGTPRS